MTDVPLPLKRCPKCGETKPHEAFAKDRTKKDGRHSHCKACVNSRDMRQYRRTYDEINADAIRERKKRYYIENGERIRQQHRDYYAANAQAILDRQHAFYMNNTEMILARNRAAEANHRDTRLAISHRRCAHKKGNGGVFTRQELTTMRLTQAGICAYCQRQYAPNTLTIDHIIPINQGGRHEAANICLACERCNKSKNKHTPEQWVKRWYLRDLSSIPAPRKKKKAT